MLILKATILMLFGILMLVCLGTLFIPSLCLEKQTAMLIFGIVNGSLMGLCALGLLGNAFILIHMHCQNRKS